jgi:hypothetical protein
MVQLAAISYDAAERKFLKLLEMEHLDEIVAIQPWLIVEFGQAVNEAIAMAYHVSSPDHQAHQFLQHILYRINRLKLFWYDDLDRYVNEHSVYLNRVRDRIETAWQQWELSQINVETLQELQPAAVKLALQDRTAADADPPLSENGRYFRDEVTKAGYRRLLAIASLDGLVEASQLSRTLGGVGNEIHAVLTRLLVEEYGAGRLSRKHSTFFTTMLEALDMDTTPEAYFDLVPWEVLAIINHSFFLSDRKRHFLRYIGGLLYGELTVPATFIPYRKAGERLGIPAKAMSYWDLHIKVDELHGQWMLEDVALPLVDRYPDRSWELVLGYDQQKYLGNRAGKAIAAAIKAADHSQDYLVPLER